MASYRIDGENKYFIMMDGQRASPEFEDVGIFPYFDREGRLFYTAKIGGRWSLMLGKEQVKTEIESSVNHPVFSFDGSKVVEAIKKDNGKYRIMMNGKVISPEMDGTYGIGMTQDGEKVTYGIKSGGKWFVMVNDKKVSPEFDGLWITPFFSPDGKLAYGAKQDGNKFIMINDRKVSVDIDYSVEVFYSNFVENGRIAFVWYDKEKREIIYATLSE